MSSKPTYEQLQNRIVHLEGLVSELRMSERTVRLSEQRFKKIYKNLQDVYYEASLEGTILEVSPSVENFSMYKREELISRSLYEFYSDVQERDLFVERIIKDIAVYDYEIHLKDKDGSLHLCSISTVLARSPEGMPEKLIGSIRDITERKQAEQSLRQVKEWVETIQQTIQSGVFVIESQSHTIIDVNRAAEEMIGADREEIVGNVCHTFVCPNALGECPITDMGCDIHDDETILLRKDGGQTEVIKTVNSVTINECEYLIESFIDISARRQAEENAKAHQKRFKIFFSSLNDAIFVHPFQKEGFAPFIEVNEIACERYGYTREEFFKLTAADITKKAEADNHAKSSNRKKLFDTKRQIFESAHIKKSGEEFPVEINANIVEQYGVPVIISVVRDISERKQAEIEKSHIEEQYRQAQKVEAIGRLAGGVAHERPSQVHNS